MKSKTTTGWGEKKHTHTQTMTNFGTSSADICVLLLIKMELKEMSCNGTRTAIRADIRRALA